LKPRTLTESADAEFSIEVPEGLADLLLGALQPEADRSPSPRSRVSMEAEGRRFTIRISASDISALRAALNSYLRWAGTVLDVVERAGRTPCLRQ